MPEPHCQALSAERWTIVVRGVIQGVGFRPFIYNTARSLGLSGWVQNEADTVRIEVQGPVVRLGRFLEALHRDHPPQARIEAAEVTRATADEGSDAEFQIRSSDTQGTPRPTIPADLAMCAACREEITTPGERRYQYPFTNCTNCGPRWSIILELPYDRPRTSMAGFRMCAACEAEYRDPADRRFHAQPIACPHCGPRLELIAPGHEPVDEADLPCGQLRCGQAVVAEGQPALATPLHGGCPLDPLDEGALAVREGRILALKGLGGFQLIVDATNPEAVTRLRRRKRRPDKPLAVMLASLDEVRARCEVSAEEARTLQSPQAPILLLRRRRDARAKTDIADPVAPGNPYLGVMLPYTPLHHLLMDRVGRPIVCTSGNLSEEPMAVCTEEALARLGPIADVFLVHDRPIVRPVDDSVARFLPEGLQLLRRARGYAPLPIELGESGPTVLAVGGHLKNTVALALGSQVVVSQHVGDLDHVASVQLHQRMVEDLLGFFRAKPDAVACDLHPDYASTRYAERLAAQWGVPLVRVQHHHAHVAACMAEHRLEGPVLGLSWDGTGYGLDGTVWGGEALECDWTETTPRTRDGNSRPGDSNHTAVEESSVGPLLPPRLQSQVAASFRRVAHLRTFALAGGDRAVREPRRSALGLLFEVFGEGAAPYVAPWFSPEELRGLFRMLGRPRICPRTSSLGRLFDAAAALCGLPAVISFEGQAAMALEFVADESCEESYCFDLGGEGPWIADWEPVARALLADRAEGVPIERISARFHNGLADLAVAIAGRWGGRDVVLSGGCFQNALLARRVSQRLASAGFRVHTHRLVPPNDGGIALGQAAVAARLWGR